MPQRLAAVRTVISRLVTPAFPAAGGPRSVAADNWESRLPGGAFPLRPN